MDISEVGLEIVKRPITAVRLQHHAGKWYVEYRRQPKFYFDQWWWFDDSIFRDYQDAKYRSEVLAAEGHITEIQKKQPHIITVNQQV